MDEVGRVGTGLRLRDWREALGLTQLELVRALGGSRSAVGKVSHWESGRRLPPVADVLTLCEMFPLTIEYVYQGHEGRMEAAMLAKIKRGRLEAWLHV